MPAPDRTEPQRKGHVTFRFEPRQPEPPVDLAEYLEGPPPPLDEDHDQDS